MSGRDAETIARDIAERGMDALRPRLHADIPPVPLIPTRGDYDLGPGTRPDSRGSLAPAAVLLPIVQRAEPQILFTERTAHLPRHAGQVSFPGGRAHASDASLVETALRETREETGIASDFVTVAGFLDTYETGTGYAILPVVGLVREGFALMPCANEVADVFEVPLAFLLDAKNRERHSREWQGRLREFYAFTYDGHFIWGATAAMLVDFGERLIR